MSAATDNKQERTNLRLKPQAKDVLERAASFEGRMVNHFTLTSAMASAERTIQEREVMHLNAQDTEALVKALYKPVRLNSKLLATLEEHDQRVTSK